MRQKPVYVLNHSQHNFRKRSTQEDLDEIEDWTDRAAKRMYEGAGLGPNDVDIFDPYDGYAPMAQFFLEGFQWHGVKRGDAFAFYAGDIRVEGPHPFCSSGGNLGNGRTRTAMYTDSIEQLRGTAGARQVKVRAETALAAFTTPSSGGWIMFGKSPRRRPVTGEITGSRRSLSAAAPKIGSPVGLAGIYLLAALNPFR